MELMEALSLYYNPIVWGIAIFIGIVFLMTQTKTGRSYLIKLEDWIKRKRGGH